MTTHYHSAIEAGAAASAATFNTPLAALDSQIKTNTDALTAYTSAMESIEAGKATAAVSIAGIVRQSTLTLTLTDTNKIELADGADNSVGVKVYTFPAGRILVLGAVINCTTTIDGASGGAATAPLAVGTTDATAADNATLDGTEADIIPSTATANGASTWKAALAASAQFDGTTTAVALYVNAGVTDAISAGSVTVVIAGTLTVTWINLGDY